MAHSASPKLTMIIRLNSFPASFHFVSDHTDPSVVTGSSSCTGELTGCTVKMRNLPEPTTMKVRYTNKTLTVYRVLIMQSYFGRSSISYNQRVSGNSA